MNNTKMAVMVTLHKITVKGKKHYASPKIDTIIGLLADKHNTTIKRRWIFQCLRDLENAGYISRRKRYRKNAEGEWIQIPSMLAITLKGAKWLLSKGIDGAGALVKQIMNWLRGDDKRWPEPPAMEPLTTEQIRANKLRLRELIRGIV